MATLWKLGERLSGGLAVALLAVAVMAAGGSAVRADDPIPPVEECASGCSDKQEPDCKGRCGGAAELTCGCKWVVPIITGDCKCKKGEVP